MIAGAALTGYSDLLGQGTVSMIVRYTHLARENVRAVVTRLVGESRMSNP